MSVGGTRALALAPTQAILRRNGLVNILLAFLRSMGTLFFACFAVKGSAVQRLGVGVAMAKMVSPIVPPKVPPKDEPAYANQSAQDEREHALALTAEEVLCWAHRRQDSNDFSGGLKLKAGLAEHRVC